MNKKVGKHTRKFFTILKKTFDTKNYIYIKRIIIKYINKMLR